MSSRGMFDTRAVYGFTMVLLSFLKTHCKGNPVAVVFEGERKAGKKDFRTEVYPRYKEGRGSTPTGIIEAIPWVKRMCHALGLSVIEVDVFEADDTIASLVRKARRAGVKSVIVSIDKDFRQLLEADRVEILRPGQRGSFELVSEQSFRTEFMGLHPRQYVDVLTLIGDTSDGLRGVPGIGKLTAPRLVVEYGSLESLLAAVRAYFEVEEPSGRCEKKAASAIESLPLITHRIARNLRDNEQHALLVKRLITVRETVPLGCVSWNTLKRKPVKREAASELVRKLEFTNRNVLSRILRSADDVPEFSPREESMVKNKVQDIPLDTMEGREILNYLHQNNVTSNPDHSEYEPITPLPSVWDFNDVQYSLDPSEEEIENFMSCVSDAIAILPLISKQNRYEHLHGIAICSSPGRSIYIDLSVREKLPSGVENVLNDHRVDKRGWFLKDLYKHILTNYAISIGGKTIDNRVASEVIHAGERITDSRLASLYLKEGALDPWVSGRDHRISPSFQPEQSLALSDMAFRISDKLQKTLKDRELFYLTDSVEFPLVSVLGDMEIAGVPIDRKGLTALQCSLKEQLEDVEKQLKEIVPARNEDDKPFRPSSRDEVANILFEIWGIEMKLKKTGSGKLPVNQRVLSMIANNQELENEHRQFARLMLQHREVSKIISTYTKSLLSAVECDGRIRATFVQEAAASGRLSTVKPNLQSIPVRSPLGREVRGMVRPEKGFSILCADYSQIELRIMASLSGDKSLLAAFANGEDIHASVALKIFKVSSLAEVTDDQRRKAKEVNYGIPYGISPYGLGQQLNMPTREASALIYEYYEEFPLVKKLTEKLILEAKDNGYAKTILGRRLPLPLLLHGGPQEQRAASRIAVNMPIQGTQADMIKLAMIRISKRLRAAGAKSRLIMQVHDELILEVIDSEEEAVTSLVKEEMTMAIPLPGVEVVVNTGYGRSWLDAAHS